MSTACHQAKQHAQPPLGLLQLPPHLQETILFHLDERQLQCGIPLVCKQLNELQKDSRELWRSYYLYLSKDFYITPDGLGYEQVGPEFSEVKAEAMRRFFEQRRGAITFLTMKILDNHKWLAVAGACLALVAPSLWSLELMVQDDTLAGPTVGLARFYAPLADAVQLRDLQVVDYTFLDVQPPSLQQLTALRELEWCSRTPPAALPQGLTSLELHCFNSQQAGWWACVSGLTALRRLETDARLVAGSTALLSELRDLEDLGLCGNGMPDLPLELSTLRRLTRLSLYDNFLGAAANWGVLRHLPALLRLDLCRCGLVRLPASISALRHLEALNLDGNTTLQVTSEDVVSVLARLTSLSHLDLGSVPVGGVRPQAWAALARAAPRLGLACFP